ncbi:MAG: hypothetical protein EOO07_38945, partial [Chitinophagaceae bacterium]
KEIKKYLFLTNELYHSIIYREKKFVEENNIVCYIGNEDPDLILTKEKFLEFVDKQTSADIPTTYNYSQAGEVRFPVIVKFKSSFINGQKFTQKKIVHSRAELEEYVGTLKVEGVPAENLLFQELLSTKAEDNVSVCGWYEEGKPVLFQTRKILQHPKDFGNGDVVELMQLDPALRNQTIDVCSKLNFIGPFELEFIKSADSENYKVIEMNPRFWMQHGLIESNSGNYLVARYLGLPASEVKKNYSFWIYPMYAYYRAIKGDLAYWPYIFRKDTYWPVSTKEAFTWLYKFLLKKI